MADEKKKTTTQEELQFDSRPVTEEDIRNWCMKMRGCKTNGLVVSIPNFKGDMILELGGPIMRVKVVDHKLLLVQVCTGKPERKYKIYQNPFFKRRISIVRLG